MTTELENIAKLPLAAAGSSFRNRKVALLTNIPAPYRMEMFRLLGERYQLKVFFDAPSEPNRSWQVPAQFPFDHEYLGSNSIHYTPFRPDIGLRERRYLQLSFRTFFALRKFAPDVVISGEMGFRTLQSSLYASLHKVPLIIWWEGTRHSEGWATSKRALRRYLSRRAVRFWSNGSESSRLLMDYGVDPMSIDEPMIGIDTRRHWAEVTKARAQRTRIRAQLGLEGTALLFVGQFHARKGIVQFLRALEALQALTASQHCVVFVGDGPERSTLERWQAEHKSPSLHILDFVQPEQLFQFYGACDVMVCPTLEDNWSLVTLEAAAAGMPQVFSDRNGASADLLSLDAAGACIDPYDTTRFAEVLRTFVERPPETQAETTTQRIIDHFSSEALVERACACIESSVAESVPPA